MILIINIETRSDYCSVDLLTSEPDASPIERIFITDRENSIIFTDDNGRNWSIPEISIVYDIKEGTLYKRNRKHPGQSFSRLTRPTQTEMRRTRRI